jgi:hypothetical protein
MNTTQEICDSTAAEIKLELEKVSSISPFLSFMVTVEFELGLIQTHLLKRYSVYSVIGFGIAHLTSTLLNFDYKISFQPMPITVKLMILFF